MLWFLALRVTLLTGRGLSLTSKTHCSVVFAAGSGWATGDMERGGIALLPDVLTPAGPSPRCYQWPHCS